MTFADNLYTHELFSRDLNYDRATGGSHIRTKADSLIRAKLDSGYWDEPDPLWSLSASAPEWNVVRSIFVQRIKVSAYARDFEESQLAATMDLIQAVEAEISR